MMRHLYCCLLWLHPPEFRRQFGDEMLWIFDESPAAHAALCADGAVSLMRQWLLRTGWWKFAIGSALALAELAVGGFGSMMFGRRTIGHATSQPMVANLWQVSSGGGLAHEPITVAILIYLAVLVLCGLLLLVLGLGFWLKSVQAHRRPVALKVR